jgi:hypothetical protein
VNPPLPCAPRRTCKRLVLLVLFVKIRAEVIVIVDGRRARAAGADSAVRTRMVGTTGKRGR